VATDFGQRHIHGNNLLKGKKEESTKILEGSDLYSALPKL
jgi:hypothetical protein